VLPLTAAVAANAIPLTPLLHNRGYFLYQKFLMLWSMSILVAKIMPQETWLYSTIVDIFCTKNF
jgi:hypothetical protein